MTFLFKLTNIMRLTYTNGLSSGFINNQKAKKRLISLTSQHWATRLVPFKLADIGEGIREVTIKEWFVKVGDKVNQFDNICEVQSDKASVTITSRFDGTIKTLHHNVNEICLVGSSLVDIEIESTEDENPESIVTESTIIKKEPLPLEQPKVLENKALTTPAVRRIAKENEIDLTKVPATGKDGRVLKEDVLAYLSNIGSKTITTSTTKINSMVDKLTPIVEKKYAKHMWKSMTQSLTIPHFVYSDECNVTKLVNLRNEVKESFQSQGLVLSYMPFVIKSISKALIRYPELNAHVDLETQSLDVKKEHNVSFAMDTPSGLIVPNIKNVQDLDILQIAKELNRLQELGKKSSVPLDDLSNGTITISNIGIIGGTYMKPVILSPQVVIGAIGKIQNLPRFDESGKIVATSILTISWAADHRVVDGATMAKFSNLWKHYIENPSQLILGL